MSRLICLLVGLIGAAQLVARLLESFTLESAATPSVIILFAFAMDLLVRRSSTHTAERQLRAISLLQTQIELHDQQARPPLAFAFCHPDVLREIIAAAGRAGAGRLPHPAGGHGTGHPRRRPLAAARGGAGGHDGARYVESLYFYPQENGGMNP